MKASLLARSALASLVALVLAAPAARSQSVSEPAEGVMRPSYALLRTSLAQQAADLRTSIAYDSVFLGHSHTDHSAGGLNPWNVFVGTARPNVNRADNALWDFDSPVGLGTPDSLQGWWPVRMPYRYAPISTMTDDQRPWGCVDQGNQLSARPIMTRGRTFGVVSAWHADPGNAAGSVRWAPISGARSMWCGLRALNDASVIDPVTHQPFDEHAVMYNAWAANTAAAPTYRAYPGYGNQWDQMLYRDVAVTSGQPLAIAFLYRTRLSTAFATGVTTRTGWFHGDPLTMSTGNFISASLAGVNAPRDSFSVYIGVPVDDADVALSDPIVTGGVFDKQRRWFNEVLRLDAPRFEILGVAGARPADTLDASVSYAATIPWADPGNGDACVSAIGNAPGNAGHLVRLVFRVKTNRSYSDDDFASGNGAVGDGWSSDGRGAVLLDDVVVNGTTFDFEGANGGVDDALDGSGHWVTPPTSSWKTTGKPVPAYVHPVNILIEAHWNDLCGNAHASTSTCDLNGIVASVGNADQNEAIADARWPAFTESIHGMLSPTINLCAPASGANAMGVTAATAAATDDWYVQYELNWAAFVIANTGTLWNFGVQCYPALAPDGHATWSDVTGTPFRLYQSFPGCGVDLQPLRRYAMVHTSNPSGIPDSLRLYLGITSECFFFGGTCNTTDGGYLDDVSLVFVNRASADPVGGISADIWQWFNDAFPVNGLVTDNVPAGSAAFDTTTAYVKGAINTAAPTGDVFRFDVLADSIVVAAPNGASGTGATRVDLVFRILPGPGNYRASGARGFPPNSGMTLLQLPTNQALAATPGDGSFWGQYMQTPGEFASPGAHHGHAWWDYLAWNSARCDTVETNIFPVVGRASSGVTADGGLYQSTYHELDPHFATLGIAKGRCFMVDPDGAANSTNLSCDPAWNAANLAWPLAPGTGFDGAWTTKEYTKIIPDGLLTPGSHVQYFFRKSRVDLAGGFAMVPDTTTISPQRDEANFDAHRWQSFGVLPDRWKAPVFGGSGMACMLVIDQDDRRGDECAWVSVLDSIGGTSHAQWGANNGWHAIGAGFSLDAWANPDIASAYVYGRNRQPGTVWDLYGVKASESSTTCGTRIGNRYANAPTGLMAGKGAAIGPRKDWLRAYYRGIAWLTGDLDARTVGPVADAGEDDIGVVEDFLAQPGGTSQPRTLFVQGDGFAQQLNDDGGAQLDFLNNVLFAGLVDESYTNLTISLVECPTVSDPDFIITNGLIFGVENDCTTLNDVLDVNGEARVAMDYQNVGVNGPYHAGIEHLATPAHNWNSLLLGWDMQGTHDRYCGIMCARPNFYYMVLLHTFGALCASWTPRVGGYNGCYLDVTTPPPPAADFARIGGSLAIGGHATVRFGVAQAGNVRVTLFDLAGRRVRTLADRAYAAGEYVEPWDGRDDAGHDVRHGVYFARIEFADGTRINGRVIVLR